MLPAQAHEGQAALQPSELGGPEVVAAFTKLALDVEAVVELDCAQHPAQVGRGVVVACFAAVPDGVAHGVIPGSVSLVSMRPSWSESMP